MEPNSLNEDKREEIIRRMIHDKDFRLGLVRRGFYWFAHYYFREDVRIAMAEFQKEMIHLLQSSPTGLLVIAGFRGCGKSTIATRMYPIWAITGSQRKRFVVILGQTQRQAEQALLNIREQLERNERLIADLGPFQEERDQWGRLGLVIRHYGAKILAASSEQPIRGMTYLGHRPDLMILDDVESLESVSTPEGRKKTMDWFQGDIIPAGDVATKIVVVGGVLHPDSFLPRLKSGIERGEIDGVFRAYPIIDGSGAILWPGKYPDQAAIDAEKKKGQGEVAWYREYLLQIIEDSDRVVLSEWIKYYDEILESDADYSYTAIAIDPAVSKNASADFTAIVVGDVYGYGDAQRIYIHPHPVNTKSTFHEINGMTKDLSRRFGKGSLARIYVEEAGQQGFITQDLIREGYPATGVKPHGNKKFRLAGAAAQVQAGKVFFPRQGAEELTQQLLNFGRAAHDDLVDAFSMLVNQIVIDDYDPWPEVIWLG